MNFVSRLDGGGGIKCSSLHMYVNETNMFFRFIINLFLKNIYYLNGFTGLRENGIANIKYQYYVYLSTYLFLICLVKNWWKWCFKG